MDMAIDSICNDIVNLIANVIFKKTTLWDHNQINYGNGVVGTEISLTLNSTKLVLSSLSTKISL